MNYEATAKININATPAAVWDALTNPEKIKVYMFGAEAVSDWKQGSQILYRGDWQGQPYEDKGTILEIEPEHILKASYWSVFYNEPDALENYRTVTYEMNQKDGQIELTITQQAKSQEEADRSTGNWQQVLSTLKELVEKA